MNNEESILKFRENILPKYINFIEMTKKRENITRNAKIFNQTRINITFKGETKNLRQWAKDLKLNYSMLRARIKRFNWDVEKALTTPKFIGGRNG